MTAGYDELHVQVAQGPYIAATSLSLQLLNGLKRKLQTLCFEEIDPRPEQADVRIQMKSRWVEHVPESGWQMVALYGFWLTTENGVVTVYFLCKRTAIVRICFSRNMTIELVDHPKSLGRLNNALMFCLNVAFVQQSKLLLHGSAFAKNDHAFLVFGQRGIGKTQMSLNLLHQGWSCLADDKFVLNNGDVHRFQKTMLLRDHHFQALPWLTGVVSNDNKSKLSPSMRKWLRRLIHTYVPEKLLPNEDRILNHGRQYSVEQLFPSNPICKMLHPDAVIILRPAQTLSCHRIAKSQAISHINLLQRLANAEFNSLSDFVAINDGIEPYSLLDKLDDHLSDAPCYLLAIPQGLSIDNLCKELVRCIQLR